MYTDRNFKTKKELKEAVAKHLAGEGPAVTYYQPGGFFPTDLNAKMITVEGPHYPQPHKWYARCETKNGVIIKVS